MPPAHLIYRRFGASGGRTGWEKAAGQGQNQTAYYRPGMSDIRARTRMIPPSGGASVVAVPCMVDPP
jgi:hypothetical protein